MRFRRVQDWLNWQQGLNPRGIDLGLDRVRRVGERLGVLAPAPLAITVGGTNGKGSVVAFLESMLMAAGYRVGSYTSPHILHYHERIRVNGKPIDDDHLCRAFAHVDAARDDEPLTYFEFGTLAALDYFRSRALDVVVLEVGLGGRLDAVNIVDSNVAVVTSIGFDHVDWLGSDLDGIAREKAGIFRAGRPAVVASREPPRGLLDAAAGLGARLIRLGRDYDFEARRTDWLWRGPAGERLDLPHPALPGAHQLQNAAGAVAAARALSDALPVPASAIAGGVAGAVVAGRFQVVPGAVPLVLDVAHNAEAAGVLAETLTARPMAGRNLAVCGMLKDKPIDTVGRAMDSVIDRWYCGGLAALPRGLDGAALARRLSSVHGAIAVYDDIAGAFAAARAEARDGDRIVIFGSFHTVEAILRLSDG